MKKFVNINDLKQNELEKEELSKVNGGKGLDDIFLPPLTGVIAYPDPEPFDPTNPFNPFKRF